MKRSEHLEPLSHDHYAGLHVTRRLHSGLDAGASPDEMEAYVVHFWDAYLTEHFRQEETLLITPLESVDGAGLADRMVDEHRMLGSLVDTMRGETGGANTVETFAEKLKAHIRFEEREVFPHLEQRLDDGALRSIGEQLHADHDDPDLSWRVAFWE